MKFFVTGVGGQLGHDVMNELLKRGHGLPGGAPRLLVLPGMKKRRAAGSQQQQRSEDQQGSADALPHAFFLFLSSTAPAITSSAPAAASTQIRALFTPV